MADSPPMMEPKDGLQIAEQFRASSLEDKDSLTSVEDRAPADAERLADQSSTKIYTKSPGNPLKRYQVFAIIANRMIGKFAVLS
jgi:hypothetical protein